jgi:NhaP-type Na+/H+ or K+/H+ antiporter
MPMSVAYSLGYTFACVGPSIVDPCLMVLTKKRYGIKNGISSTLIASGIFDDVLCNICFVICKGIAFSKIEPGQNGHIALIFVFVEVFTGIGGGIMFGLLGWFFKYIPNKTVRIWMKYLYCMMLVIGFPVTSEVTGFTEIRFIGILFCGYTLFRVWGEEKP